MLRIAAAALLSLTALPGCASTASPDNAQDATLQNVDDSALRETIRVFVREHAGRDVIARPDSLASKAELELTARLRTDGMKTADALKATPTFRLQRDRTGGCWIVRDADASSPSVARKLPATAICNEVEES